MDRAANLAIFLTEKTGSCLNTWCGKMAAAEQRELLGRFLGKGTVCVNGADETVKHTVKVCFGLDHEVTFEKQWRAL